MHRYVRQVLFTSQRNVYYLLKYSISFEVMLPSACSFIVDGLTFSCRCSTLHVSAYMAIIINA
jgi:hypothetical protein